ncbi:MULTISPECIES: dTMP kinase [Colwellia]|uniref:Thymidylate kinase n=1 Tax=Colwellia psychrerythraea (strain 34H / ATCC BAA-681) TaxID=167879 RepID=KTHY_COLP3|nr:MULTISPECIES: dTMP kinase [Colwellia]Q482J5.1 RecName: Full=Thymidylate kinase; AltName: Full=dTMP kinase [Colwellia psychrerythraea 34H]AAZ25441.1 thymidylate kinase [Colwellia psychrerythraea 34H]PKH87810.1 thymidylate kinase [Colwellia sp. Bg11-28]
MSTGKFIVIEGMEGAGKSSAIAVIESTLNKHGIEYINTREPGGTPLAESLRDMVKSVDHQEKLTVETELLLMYASRSQLLANKILPALAAGKWVIGDRHDLSSRAYQGGGRGFDETIMNTISDITLKGFRPDITLYLDIDPHIGLSRAKARGDLDRIELEKMEFFIRVHNKYRELAEQDDSIITVDAAQAMLKVHQDVEKAVIGFITNTDKG